MNRIWYKCDKKFWRDTIEACNRFFKNSKNMYVNNAYSLPFRYNSQIYEDVSKDWFHKGLRYIRDFFINQSTITLQYLCTIKLKW